MDNQNRCVCCNKPIPESEHCCSWCKSNVTINDTKILTAIKQDMNGVRKVEKVLDEMSKGELTKELYVLKAKLKSYKVVMDKLVKRFDEIMAVTK